MCLQKTMLLTQANLLCETAASRSQEQARMLASISHSTMCDVACPSMARLHTKRATAALEHQKGLTHTTPHHAKIPRQAAKATPAAAVKHSRRSLCSIMRNNDKIHTDVSRKLQGWQDSHSHILFSYFQPVIPHRKLVLGARITRSTPKTELL